MRYRENAGDLPLPWKRIQGAIWMLGIAILFWQGWWWPGILVLIAISGVFQAAVQIYLGRQESQTAEVKQAAELAQQRADWLPSTCPQCGGPIGVETVQWIGEKSAICPYCSAKI
jgi:hypothetical protein